MCYVVLCHDHGKMVAFLENEDNWGVASSKDDGNDPSYHDVPSSKDNYHDLPSYQDDASSKDYHRVYTCQGGASSKGNEICADALETRPQNCCCYWNLSCLNCSKKRHVSYVSYHVGLDSFP